MNNEWIGPDDLDTELIDVEIKPEDLDDAGVYRFKDPNDSGKPMTFVTSKFRIQNFEAGGTTHLNFDFIGTYYNFDTASTGTHQFNNKDDNFNDPVLGQYLVKGKI